MSIYLTLKQQRPVFIDGLQNRRDGAIITIFGFDVKLRNNLSWLVTALWLNEPLCIWPVKCCQLFVHPQCDSHLIYSSRTYKLQ